MRRIFKSIVYVKRELVRFVFDIRLFDGIYKDNLEVFIYFEVILIVLIFIFIEWFYSLFMYMFSLYFVYVCVCMCIVY